MSARQQSCQSFLSPFDSDKHCGLQAPGAKKVGTTFRFSEISINFGKLSLPRELGYENGAVFFFFALSTKDLRGGQIPPVKRGLDYIGFRR